MYCVSQITMDFGENQIPYTLTLAKTIQRNVLRKELCMSKIPGTQNLLLQQQPINPQHYLVSL